MSVTALKCKKCWYVFTKPESMKNEEFTCPCCKIKGPEDTFEVLINEYVGTGYKRTLDEFSTILRE